MTSLIHEGGREVIINLTGGLIISGVFWTNYVAGTQLIISFKMSRMLLQDMFCVGA